MSLLKTELSKPSYEGLSDAEAAELLSVPTLVPRRHRITFVTLADVWGLERAVVFKASLGAMARSDIPTAAATADMAITILSGVGFDPGHAEAAKAGAAFVAAGLCTEEEVVTSQFTRIYPAGTTFTAEQVAIARAEIARAAAASTLRQRVLGLASTWVNDVLNPAEAGDGELPTLAEFKAVVANA